MKLSKPTDKKLIKSLKRKAGRNNQGRITVRHQGGGAKKLYRIIDFKGDLISYPAKVKALEYDPYRTCHIMLLEGKDNKKSYQIAPQNIQIGQEIFFSDKLQELKTGNRTKLKNIPTGTSVYNIELEPRRGGRIVRSAGSSATVLGQEGKYTILQMPSKETRKILQDCSASIGAVSYPEWRYRVIKKAGTSRLMGKRPSVRGSAMNPVDHPHGGGEGRAPIGMKHPKTPWGKPALGKKTRKRKKWTNKYIIKRRK
ncbi:MAG: 50S ribosomal protein L2 [Candidatus Pacebacteria bacterium]|nr:50S ribosomal protein L2 [Candidatus Paceibacterota bacterium]